jgi:hypothetical protein
MEAPRTSGGYGDRESRSRLRASLDTGGRTVSACIRQGSFQTSTRQSRPGSRSPPSSGLCSIPPHACRDYGLRLPQVNVLVEGKLVDFYWPDKRLVVESDSYNYRADRPAFERDHQSTVDLEVAGYRVLRTTAKMLNSNPAPFLRLVRDSLTD